LLKNKLFDFEFSKNKLFDFCIATAKLFCLIHIIQQNKLFPKSILAHANIKSIKIVDISQSLMSLKFQLFS
jgi:hypothetical protein